MTIPSGSFAWYKIAAQVEIDKYFQVQRVITAHEQEAIEAASGHKPAAERMLKDKTTPQGFEYMNLCADRARHMQIAQLMATMALVLKGD